MEQDKIDQIISTPTTDGNDETRKSRRKAGPSTILPKECLFCKKRKTKNRKEEKLHLCIDDRAEKTIRSAAKEKNDYDILSISDLISSEAHYHKTCYVMYVKPNDEKEKSEQDIMEAEAFEMIVRYCLELETVRRNQIISFKYLVMMMENKLTENNLVMKASTRKNLKRKLENKVSSIRFINLEMELYVYSKNISLEDVISQYVTTKKELDALKEKYENQSIEEINLVKIMLSVREEIKDLTDSIPWPPQPKDLVPDKVEIPPLLNLVLTTLLQGRAQVLNQKKERIRMSIGQDLVYAVTEGMSNSFFFFFFFFFLYRHLAR